MDTIYNMSHAELDGLIQRIHKIHAGVWEANLFISQVAKIFELSYSPRTAKEISAALETINELCEIFKFREYWRLAPKENVST